jgi:hypothetical protein
MKEQRVKALFLDQFKEIIPVLGSLIIELKFNYTGSCMHQHFCRGVINSFRESTNRQHQKKKQKQQSLHNNHLIYTKIQKKAEEATKSSSTRHVIHFNL